MVTKISYIYWAMSELLGFKEKQKIYIGSINNNCFEDILETVDHSGAVSFLIWKGKFYLSLVKNFL